jgi:hypothetical protein
MSLHTAALQVAPTELKANGVLLTPNRDTQPYTPEELDMAVTVTVAAVARVMYSLGLVLLVVAAQ